MLRLKLSIRQGASAPSINMTPMVDMVFLLLIFFLLTSMAMRPPVLDLSLPQADHAEKNLGREDLQIVIHKAGQIEINRKPVRRSQLQAELKAQLAAQPEKKVVLSADAQAPFGVFVSVIDTLHALNHHNLAIASQSLKEAP